MKSDYVKKAAQESLQRIEKQYGPERAAKVKAARKAFGEYVFSVIGYCERCGGPIHQIDHHILREGYHLCSDCFTVLMDEAYEGQAEETTTITISIWRAVDGTEELTTTRDVKDWDSYVLDLGIKESKEQPGLQHKVEALRKQLAGGASCC